MHHILYKTTCIPTGKFYIGMHSTKNLDDGYLGSGLILQHSINKHGRENHVRTILAFAADRKELIELEKTFVTEDLVRDEQSMNIALGGHGGRVKLNYLAEDREQFGKIQAEKWKDPAFRIKVVEGIKQAWTSEDYRARKAEQSSAMWTPERKAQHAAATKGLKRTKETRKLISEANIGIRCMTNGVRSIRVKADQVESYKLLGYRLGRK